MLANEELDEGINFNQISSQVCMIAGTAAGGVLVAIAPGLAIGLDLLSFFPFCMPDWCDESRRTSGYGYYAN